MSIRLPDGPVRTPTPQGGSFGVPWSRAEPLLPIFESAGNEFGVDPRVMVCMGLIESTWTHERNGQVITRYDSYDSVPSTGVLQVKIPYWKHLIPGVDATSLEGNIRLGTAVMGWAIKQHGSWQKALTKVYFPGDDVNGTSQDAYVKCVESLLAELDAVQDQPASQSQADQFASVAEQQVGKPYRWGTAGPNTFDCSGLVSFAASKVGLSISRDSHAQFKLGTAVARDQLRRGDILCYDTANGTEVREGNRASHVGIYLGPGRMVNALNESAGVVISDPFSSYFAPLYLGARRLFAVQEQPEPPVQAGPKKPTQPKIVDRWLHEWDGDLWPVTRYIPNRNGFGNPVAIAVHVQEGTSGGTLQHFRSVKAGCHYTVNRDGSIWRLVREEHGAWCNGDTCAPSAKGRALINQYGSDPNQWTLSIEVEGFTYAGNPLGWPVAMTSSQEDALVWLTMDLMERHGIPLDRVIRHSDLNSCTRAGCPGDPIFLPLMSRLQGKVVEPVPAPTSYEKPVKVPGFDGTRDVVVNGTPFHAEPRTVTAAQDLNVRKYADDYSALTRGPVKAGQTFPVLGWVQGKRVDGESRWWITATHSRVWVGNTNEKPGDQQPKHYDHGEVVGGIRHFPTDRKVTTSDGKVQARYWYIDQGGQLHWKLPNGHSVLVSATPEHPE